MAETIIPAPISENSAETKREQLSVYSKAQVDSIVAQSTAYAAGSTVPHTAFRGMGRVVNAGNAIFVYIVLDRRITATSFTITCNGCYFFNSGATLAAVSTPQTITYSGNSGLITGNTIAFTVPVTNSLTAQEIYLMEMFNTTIKFA